jgi:Domain of unknown function (DUF1963)
VNRLEQAREIVRRCALPDELRRRGETEIGSYLVPEARLQYYDGTATQFLTTELTAQVLARSLQYVIRLKRRRIKDEESVPLGVSKYKGRPQLPPGMEWPRGQYFLVQLNLAEVHPFDIHEAFPATGMLYVFFDGEEGVTVTHYDGQLDALQTTPYPDRATLPRAKYYLKEFTKAAALLEFRPAVLFYLDSDDVYDLSTTTKLIPKAVREQVAAVLGAPVKSTDTDLRIFGRPLYWQGEDENYEGLLDVYVEDEPEDAVDGSRTRLLLLQDEFGEGHIHLWTDAERAREHDFSRVWMDYSGT